MAKKKTSKERKKEAKEKQGFSEHRKSEEFTGGFVCEKCGYKAYQLGRYSYCPLCVICERCQKTVRKCSCIEPGE